MTANLLADVLGSIARLYIVEGEGALGRLQVEACIAREGLSRIAETRILARSDDASLDLDDMTSRPVTLQTTRMEYVARIAKRFDRLMAHRRPYLEAQLRIIAGWLHA